MAALFNRKWQVTITTYGGQKYTITDPLRVTFETLKKIDRTSQVGQVTLYNLSPKIETDILQNGAELALEAGYANGPYGVIFKGKIRQPLRGKEDGTTFFLTLYCLDADDALNLGFCSFVMSNGQTAQQIAAQVARSSSVPFDIQIDVKNDQKTQRGKVVFGKPKEVLRNIAKNNDCGFYFEDGTAKISIFSKPPTGDIPLINSRTGMIGTPTQTDQGIQFRTLMRPDIKIDSWVKLNNKDIQLAELEFGTMQTILDLDGLYRVIEITATGDSRGQDWYYNIGAVSQTGPLAQMLVGGADTGVS